MKRLNSDELATNYLRYKPNYSYNPYEMQQKSVFKRKIFSNNKSHKQLLINGHVQFKNTDGYLSAHLVPNITLFPILFVFFCILTILWTIGICFLQAVGLQMVVSAIIYVGWLECLVKLLYYQKMNSNPEDHKAYNIFMLITEILR